MGNPSRQSIVERMQNELPSGSLFDVAMLEQAGVSATLAGRYVEEGYLVRVGQGLYAFSESDMTFENAMLLHQKRDGGLHVAGVTALEMHGALDTVATRGPKIVWGEIRYGLPIWFNAHFDVRYVHATPFEWNDHTLQVETLETPPGIRADVNVSVPERALLEMLYDAGIKHDLKDARRMFEQIRAVRLDLMGRLLECCTSVKSVRLFLTWARETQLVDVTALLGRYRARTGSNTRWIARLEDGSLLILKPFV